jgi:hypothetical protein
MVSNTPFSDLRRKHRTKTVPPEPYRLLADIDTSSKQKILDLPQRQRIPDADHHRQADNLGRRIERTEWVYHPTRLKNDFVCLKPFCSYYGASLTLCVFSWITGSIGPDTAVMIHIDGVDVEKAT